MESVWFSHTMRSHVPWDSPGKGNLQFLLSAVQWVEMSSVSDPVVSCLLLTSMKPQQPNLLSWSKRHNFTVLEHHSLLQPLRYLRRKNYFRLWVWTFCWSLCYYVEGRNLKLKNIVLKDFLKFIFRVIYPYKYQVLCFCTSAWIYASNF